jgi:hypothetical protein
MALLRRLHDAVSALEAAGGDQNALLGALVRVNNEFRALKQAAAATATATPAPTGGGEGTALPSTSIAADIGKLLGGVLDSGVVLGRSHAAYTPVHDRSVWSLGSDALVRAGVLLEAQRLLPERPVLADGQRRLCDTVLSCAETILEFVEAMSVQASVGAEECGDWLTCFLDPLAPTLSQCFEMLLLGSAGGRAGDDAAEVERRVVVFLGKRNVRRNTGPTPLELAARSLCVAIEMESAAEPARLDHMERLLKKVLPALGRVNEEAENHTDIFDSYFLRVLLPLTGHLVRKCSSENLGNLFGPCKTVPEAYLKKSSRAPLVNGLVAKIFLVVYELAPRLLHTSPGQIGDEDVAPVIAFLLEAARRMMTDSVCDDDESGKFCWLAWGLCLGAAITQGSGALWALLGVEDVTRTLAASVSASDTLFGSMELAGRSENENERSAATTGLVYCFAFVTQVFEFADLGERWVGLFTSDDLSVGRFPLWDAIARIPTPALSTAFSGANPDQLPSLLPLRTALPRVVSSFCCGLVQRVSPPFQLRLCFMVCLPLVLENGNRLGTIPIEVWQTLVMRLSGEQSSALNSVARTIVNTTLELVKAFWLEIANRLSPLSSFEESLSLLPSEVEQAAVFQSCLADIPATFRVALEHCLASMHAEHNDEVLIGLLALLTLPRAITPLTPLWEAGLDYAVDSQHRESPPTRYFIAARAYLSVMSDHECDSAQVGSIVAVALDQIGSTSCPAEVEAIFSLGLQRLAGASPINVASLSPRQNHDKYLASPAMVGAAAEFFARQGCTREAKDSLRMAISMYRDTQTADWAFCALGCLVAFQGQPALEHSGADVPQLASLEGVLMALQQLDVHAAAEYCRRNTLLGGPL